MDPNSLALKLANLYRCFSTNSHLRENLNLFVELIQHIDAEAIVHCIDILHPMFLNTLNDSLVNLDVKITALTAMSNFIQQVGSSKDRERFQDLLPAMMDMLNKALEENWEASAQSELEILIELAKNEPSFFRVQLVVVVGSMFDIAECESYEKKTRHLAVEFVMTLVEAREKTPGMIKKYPLFTEKYIAILLNLLEHEVYYPLLPDPYDRWDINDDLPFLKKCLWRLSHALGGKTVGPVAFEQVRAYLADDSWQKPCAALYALAQIVEGCSEVMIKNMNLVVTMVLDCMGHPHPGVRFTSMEAVREFLSFMCPHFQEQYHQQVVPALIKAMDDDSVQVQVSVICAVTGFLRDDTPKYLTLYIHGLLDKLFQLSLHTVALVQESASAVLQFLADHFKQECYGNNYESILPLFKAILVQANFPSKDVEMMMSFLKPGRSLLPKQIMEAVMSLQGSQEFDEDTNTIFKLEAIGGFCKAIGKGFLPCTSIVMPLLLQCAQLEPDKIILSPDSDHTCLDDNTIHRVKVGDSTICIKKSSLKKKAKACEVLVIVANKLNKDFYPWIFQTASILFPLLKFHFNEVRFHTVEAMKHLLQSAKLADEKGIARGESHSDFKQFSDSIILNLVEALHEEPKTLLICFETEIYVEMLNTLHVCLQICGPLLNEDQLRPIVDEIKHVITESSNSQGKLTEREKTEDFDAEEAELLRGEKHRQDQIFKLAGLILCRLIETFKVVFLPYFDELSLYLIPMWDKEMTIQERCTSLYIFDGLVKHCSEAALKYCDVFLPLLLKSSNDENPAVRQNALYGLGLYAEYHGSVFKPFVREAMSRINVVIMHLRAREPENELAYDNAVSTLGKIFQFHRELIDSAQVIPIWLNCLPIKGDLPEAKYVHGQLCSMVERSDRELLGPKYEHFPKIMSVFAEVLRGGKHLATEETAKCMINLLRKLEKEVAPDTLISAWSLLLPKQEMELKSILFPGILINHKTFFVLGSNFSIVKFLEEELQKNITNVRRM
ncbi:importin-5-like [Solanum tuberosum]|uniref:importin-5-like n=1 Tax=Solanum tuberosum TaxID=4113 RepID=UPI00073A4833|nr:PREDICTED: importin-5-like [Solanum tuberosum]